MFRAGEPLDKPVHENDGTRREPYGLGPGMAAFASAKVKYQTNVEDLYAVWAYTCYADRWQPVSERIDDIEEVFRRFAANDFIFDHKGDADDAEHLNAQIAGTLAAARIFNKADKPQGARQALDLLAKMVSERIHHERADSALIRPGKAASKGLHQAKIPRYVALVPETTAILHRFAPRQKSR